MSEDAKEMTETEIRAKILHVLSLYPIISPTMLQGGLGPYVKPAHWRPVLQKLLEEGSVIEEQESMQTPSGRYNTYTKLRLPGATVYVEARSA